MALEVWSYPATDFLYGQIYKAHLIMTNKREFSWPIRKDLVGYAWLIWTQLDQDREDQTKTQNSAIGLMRIQNN